MLANLDAVDSGPVGRTEVYDKDRVAFPTHLGVTTRDVRVVEDDGTLGQAPECDHVRADGDAAPVREDEPVAWPIVALDQLALDREGADR